jgi:hypothetical protein
MKKAVVFFLVIGVIYLIVSVNYSRNRGIHNYNNFYNSFVNGKIESIEVKLKGVGLKIYSNETEFIFYPYTSELNEKEIFNYLARKGDSVYKPAFSDTLQLVKSDKIYKYTFQKFE